MKGEEKAELLRKVFMYTEGWSENVKKAILQTSTGEVVN